MMMIVKKREDREEGNSDNIRREGEEGRRGKEEG